jgi:hypothetical protein
LGWLGAAESGTAGRILANACAGEFLHDCGCSLLAGLAGVIINTALGKSKFATAGAILSVELMQGRGSLLRREFREINAGESGSTVGILQEYFALILERFYSCRDRQVRECAHFRFIKHGIE